MTSIIQKCPSLTELELVLSVLCVNVISMHQFGRETYLWEMEDTERCGLMFIVIVHSFSHNSLGLEGVEFLCSVLPSLPNLTSLRWDFIPHVWHFFFLFFLLIPVLKFKHDKHLPGSFLQYCFQRHLCGWEALRGLAAGYNHSVLKVSSTHFLWLVWCIFTLSSLIVCIHSLLELLHSDLKEVS